MIEAYVAEASPLYRDVYAIVAPAMPEGYQHEFEFGMPTWSVPLDVYASTYNGKALQYVALAQQKNYVALYLNCLYSDSEADASFRQQYAAAVGRIDMGKSCLRLRRPEDVDARLIAEAVAATSVDDFLALYERVRG